MRWPHVGGAVGRPGRRAGNEIQLQLGCSEEDSCFWDSVAHCHAIRWAGGYPVPSCPGTRPSGKVHLQPPEGGMERQTSAE